jgi:hypothetical protein
MQVRVALASTSRALSYAITALLAVPVYAKLTGADPTLAWVNDAVTRSLVWGAFLVVILALLAVASRVPGSTAAHLREPYLFAAGTLLAACVVAAIVLVRAPGEALDVSVLQLVVAPSLAVVIPLLSILAATLAVRAMAADGVNASAREGFASRIDMITSIVLIAAVVGWYALRQGGWFGRAGPGAQLATSWLGLCLPAYLCARIAIGGGSPRTSPQASDRLVRVAGALVVTILIGMMAWS